MMDKMSNLLFGTSARRRLILWLIIIMVSALLILIVSNFIFSSGTSFSRLLGWVDPAKYQAVFLSNGQVYFGRVTEVNRQTLVLEDIYYLQAFQPLQAGEEGNVSLISGQDFSLVKLGDELHGPEDRMNINLDHVLFTENLRNDSAVVKAIAEYQGGE